MSQPEDIDALLHRVHQRTGLGVDITTHLSGVADIRWKRDYGDVGWSDLRFTRAPNLRQALQQVLEYEDEADAAEALEAQESASGSR